MIEPNTYRYRPQLRHPLTILLGFTILFTLVLTIDSIRQLFVYGPSLLPVELFRLQSVIVLFLLLSIAMLTVAFPFLAAFVNTAYLSVGPAGLDYNFLPVFRYQCRWSDIKQMGILYNQDVLFINEGCEITGNSTGLWLIETLTQSNANCIALSSFEGWPNGELAEDIGRYAPHLFRQ